MSTLKGWLIAIAFIGGMLCFFYGSRFVIRAATDAIWPGYTYSEREHRANH